MLLLPVLCNATELERVNFKCNIHTVNKLEGQTECEPLDDEFGGYCSFITNATSNLA